LLYEFNHTDIELSDIIDNILESRCKYVGYEMDQKNLEQKKLEYLLFVLAEITRKLPQNWCDVSANNERLKTALNAYNVERFKDVIENE